ncbi:MAG TPA: Gfo/Idh/MocA family oxidoreductase [Mycobacteriales bacterium]|jgi:predicted dehydrogenase
MPFEDPAARPLRVGVVGLGYAGRTHLTSYLPIPGVEVVALAGLEPDRLQALGAEHGVPHLHARWEDLVARDDLDAISVCSPTHLHAPITIAALESGRHVLCEKPLARTGAEGEQMVRAAAKAGRVLQIAFNHRERGDVHTLKQHIDDGGLGDIYYAKTRWVRRSGIPGLGSWFTNKEMSGGGPMIDLGVHMLDLTLFLLGEPQVTSVSANTYSELGSRGRGGTAGTDKQQVGSGFEVEDLGTAFLRLAGGGTLLLEASWATYRPDGDDFGVTLYGTEGGAEINVPNYAWEDTLRLYSDVADAPAVIAPRVGRGEGHRAVVRSFVEKVRGDDWAQHIGTDALARARIIDACYASAREGREVAVAADSIGLG